MAQIILFARHMPGPLLANTRSGNRAEYFAQYVLSALGVSSPVPRPEDIGIDFHCALAHKKGRLLFFEHTFGVQVGTIGSKEFRYGVSRKQKRWKFKPYETAWLFSQSLPLFVATVDQKSLTFRLYSTSPMWITKYLVGEPAEIILAPDENHNPETGVVQKKLLPKGFGNRRTYRIPLSAPVVELCLTTFTEEDTERACGALRKAIDTERQNLLYRDFGLHFVEWLQNIVPNDPRRPYEVGQFYRGNTKPGHLARQLASLFPVIISLGQNLSARKNVEWLAKIVPVFTLYEQERLPDFLQPVIKGFNDQVEQARGTNGLPPAPAE
jgi:hypothetical protein